MRKGLFYFIGWTYVVLGTPLLGVALLLRRFGYADSSAGIAQRYMSCLARLLLWLAGAKVTVEGLKTCLAICRWYLSAVKDTLTALLSGLPKVPMSFVATTMHRSSYR